MFQKWGIVSGLVCALCACGAVMAQSTAIVGSRNRVNPNTEDWKECSVAARLTDNNELVVTAFVMEAEPDSDMAVAISENGGSSFGIEYFGLGLDSGAVVDPDTDRIYVSALGPYLECAPCMSIAYRDPEDDVLSSDFFVAVNPPNGLLDKPLMGISPDGTDFFITYLRHQTGCSHAAYASYSDDPTDEQVFDPRKIEPSGGDGCEFEGWGQKPVVLDDGRVVVVFRGFDAGYNDDLPVVAYSDDNGVTWAPDDEEPVPVADGAGIEVIQPFDTSGAGDTPEPIDRRKCAPDIAVDRMTDPNEVYVSFYARAEREDATSGDHNSDIYVSRSLDTGGVLSFPSSSTRLVQFTDDMLGLTTYDDGPDQIMPSIAIDPCGGVSVVFYDNRNDPDWSDDEHWLDLYYARITDYGGDNDVQQVRLTPNSFELPDRGYLGDYHHMALGGSQPTLYPAYIAIGQNGGQNSYVNKIAILCSEDFAGYEGSEEQACALFDELCGNGTIDGDLNEDDSIDYEDAAIFHCTLEEMGERYDE